MRTMISVGTAGLLFAVLASNAYAGGNPNVGNASPYSIGAYDEAAKLGLGSGFRDAVAPGVAVGLILTPLTAIPVVANGVVRGF
jgi:hypothetical protein